MTTERLDLATSLAVVPDVTPDANNGAVCAILRYAKRTRGGRLLVDELCEALGLDLGEALAASNRHRDGKNLAEAETGLQRPPTARVRPDTLGEPIAVRSERIRGGVECIDITEHMGFCLGNVIKYIWRADLKQDAIEDLRKAVWYVQREIERREK